MGGHVARTQEMLGKVCETSGGLVAALEAGVGEEARKLGNMCETLAALGAAWWPEWSGGAKALEICVKPSEDSQKAWKSVEIIAPNGGGRFLPEARARATQIWAFGSGQAVSLGKVCTKRECH